MSIAIHETGAPATATVVEADQPEIKTTESNITETEALAVISGAVRIVGDRPPSTAPQRAGYRDATKAPHYVQAFHNHVPAPPAKDGTPHYIRAFLDGPKPR